MIVFVWLCAVRQWLVGPRLPLLIVALAIIVRVVLAMVADAPLNAENRIVHEQALKVLDGACCFSHRPLGYPIALAGAYALLGVGPNAIEALNIAFAAVTVALVWQIGNVTWGRSVAAVAATAYAVVPSQVLMVIVPLTEPMYTMLVTGAVRVAIVLERRPALAAGAVSAGLLAVAQYVRATAAPLVVLVAVLPWLVGWTLRRTLLRAALIGCLFMVLLLPVIAYNVRAYGDLSVATSAYGDGACTLAPTVRPAVSGTPRMRLVWPDSPETRGGSAANTPAPSSWAASWRTRSARSRCFPANSPSCGATRRMPRPMR